MLKPQSAILAAVLATPFGLAIHGELNKPKPTLDRTVLAATSVSHVADTRGDIAFGDIDRLAEPPLDEVEVEESNTPDADALRQVFGGERATMGPALAKLRFGMTANELRAAASEIITWNMRTDELGKIILYPEFMAARETQLSDVVLEAHDEDGAIETHLRDTWGAPQIEASGEQPAVWISADGHTRAALSAGLPADDMTTVLFSQVVPLDELLTSETAVFSFETQPSLLGATVAQLKDSYPQAAVDSYYQEYATLDIPGIASDPGASPLTRVNLTIESDAVTRMSFKIGCGSRCADVLAAFERRFGAAATDPVTAAGEDRVYRFTGPDKVSVKATIYAHEDRVVAVEASRQ